MTFRDSIRTSPPPPSKPLPAACRDNTLSETPPHPNSLYATLPVSTTTTTTTTTVVTTPTTTTSENHHVVQQHQHQEHQQHHRIIVYATKLMGDVVVAVTVTALAAPFLAVIDKALVERTTAASTVSTTATTAIHTNRSNRSITVWTSMYQTSVTILQQPGKFLKSPTFLWMWGTYAATYTAANTLRTILAVETAPTASASTIPSTNRVQHRYHDDDDNNHNNRHHYYPYYNYLPSAGTTLLMGTSIVNSTASILKDRAYAQLYGAAATTTTALHHRRPPTVPPVTYGFWWCRDLTVMGAAFVLPHYVAEFWIQQRHQSHHPNDENTKNRTLWSEAMIRRISQIVTPVVAQVVAGPLHFVGYDCYNHHHNTTLQHQQPQQQRSSNLSLWSSSSSYQFWSERWRNLRSSVGQVIAARMMRIVPGYGIAGICNTELLAQWQRYVVQPLMEDDQQKLGYRRHSHNNHHHNDDDRKEQAHGGCTHANTTTAVWDPQHHAQRC